MAQAAVERTRRQEDRSATGFFPSLHFLFSTGQPARARTGAIGTKNPARKLKRKKGARPARGAPFI
ncbi:hypothetical protein GCM10007920_28800 [Ciceribacter naphthalenivorans]|uniref:Uncharacterized protein n=1 Tax=Sphingomonas psychrolutea TaxID=1259676 RepID=A0ABQ6EE72_9SPHN|nr:hypothetical protein GCM10007920_28800 [Ciceribacter naphthalenivorans]GLT05948.1 hypothetical protein GCM10007926_28800 [Sphingomonas psychrolutea]